MYIKKMISCLLMWKVIEGISSFRGCPRLVTMNSCQFLSMDAALALVSAIEHCLYLCWVSWLSKLFQHPFQFAASDLLWGF